MHNLSLITKNININTRLKNVYIMGTKWVICPKKKLYKEYQLGIAPQKDQLSIVKKMVC